MKTKYTFWILALTILISSCTVLPSYRAVRIKGEIREAKINIPTGFEDAELFVVNRTNDINEVSGELTLNAKERNKLVDHILNEFQKEVKDRKQFEVVKGIKQAKSSVNGGFPTVMNGEIAKRLTFGRRLIASLEYINTTQKETYRNDWENTYDVNNVLIRRRQVVIGEKIVDTETGWRLYDTSGNVIDEFSINNKYFYEVKSNNSYSAESRLQNGLGLAYRNIGKNVGFKYADRISAYQTYTSRNYYIRSRTAAQFEVAMEYIDKGDWETAFGTWQEIIDFRKNKRDVSKAYFNMAVYYERLGDLDKAIEYAEISKETDLEIGNDYLNALYEVKTNGYNTN